MLRNAVLRKAVLLGGIGVFTVIGLPEGSLSHKAEAREIFGFFGPFSRHNDFAEPPSDYSRARRAPRPKRAAPRQDTPAGNKSAEKKAAPLPGPHLLVVSIKSQRVTLYANGKQAVTSPISSGTASNPTPHGVFSIIQRNRHHRSNIYSGAPMPYMQRLTWSGIALHQGALPGYPASHGCIRLPESFANLLWNTTRMNTRVIVARDDVEPQDIVHAKLFQPKIVPAIVETPLQDLRKTIDTTQHFTRTAGMQMVIIDAAAKDEAKPEAAESRPETKPEAAAAPQPADIPDTILASFERSLSAKAKRAGPTGPVSVFISRKDKRLYVRQAFVPLFTADVSFKDDAAPFGTHVFTAYAQEDGKPLRWTALTMPPEAANTEIARLPHRDARGRRIPAHAAKPAEAHVVAPPSAASVLDRIDIPQEVADRISYYMSPGSSLIVSDQGLGHETGNYTDFIVVTKK